MPDRKKNKKIEGEEVVVAGYKGIRGRSDDPSTQLFAGRTGLRNLGNSCYVNAIVQALRNVKAFEEFFMTLPEMTADQPAVGTSSTRPTKKRKGTSAAAATTTAPAAKETEEAGDEFDLEADISLVSEIKNLFRIISSGRWAAVTPYKLILAIWRHVPFFRSYKQQDAQEFLSFFLERLERELGTEELDGTGRPTPTPTSFIKDTFECNMASQTSCKGCGTVSHYAHPGAKYLVLDLSSTLTKVMQSGTTGSALRNKGKETRASVNLGRTKVVCSITDCLADLTCPVELCGDSKYHCNTCKSKQDATKQDVIQKLPRVLVFFVNRTHWSQNGKCKLDSHVDFPGKLPPSTTALQSTTTYPSISSALV
jgi:uncharacterized UBP type Zn finger protein